MAIFDKKQDLPAAEKQHSARTVLVNQRLSVIVRQCTELGACVAANGSREGQRRVSVLHAFGFDEGTKACEPVKAYCEKFYQNCTEGSVSWFCSRIAVARNRADFSFLSLLVFMFFCSQDDFSVAVLSCTLASESITLLLDFKERSISALAPPISSKVTCWLGGCRLASVPGRTYGWLISLYVPTAAANTLRRAALNSCVSRASVF